MSVTEITFDAPTIPNTPQRPANIVALCDTCNELTLNPCIDHAWDENDMYIGTTICEDC